MAGQMICRQLPVSDRTFGVPMGGGVAAGKTLNPRLSYEKPLSYSIRICSILCDEVQSFLLQNSRKPP